MFEKVYRVSGMSRGHCGHHITAAVEELAGVAKARVDFSRGQVTVRSRVELPTGDVRAVVEEAGYQLVGS